MLTGCNPALQLATADGMRRRGAQTAFPYEGRTDSHVGAAAISCRGRSRIRRGGTRWNGWFIEMEGGIMDLWDQILDLGLEVVWSKCGGLRSGINVFRVSSVQSRGDRRI